VTLVIGFGHKARHGKDEAIKTILADCPDSDARKYGFGDALKREVNEAAEAAGGMKNLFPISGMFCGVHTTSTVCYPQVKYDPVAPMDDPLCPYGKQRTLLQWWGTEYRRAQDPNYWVKKTLQQIANDQPDVALICDVRFPNEVDGIRAAGGYVVRVDRIGFVSDVPEHISEKSLDHFTPMDWDYVIEAPDGKIEVLREEALNAFNFLCALHAAV
jgi:hypothetical protein